MIDKYIVMITATITSLTILTGALVKFRKEITELFRGVFSGNHKLNSLVLHITNHQLNNIVMEIEEGVEKRVLNTVNSNRHKKQVIKTRYDILVKEISIAINNYVDKMETPLYGLSKLQMKNISQNAIIISLEISKIEAYDRIEKNHFESIQNWVGHVDDLCNHLFNVFLNDFCNRTSIEQFNVKFSSIILECENIFKKRLSDGFNTVLEITKESIKKNEKYKEERKEMIDKIIQENSN